MENCCGEGCVVCPYSYPIDEAVGANCSSGCLSKDHRSWGECIRAKNTKVLWAGSATDLGMDASFQKSNERELELYRQTRKQGIQPDNTSTPAIRRALDESDRTGTPYVSKV